MHVHAVARTVTKRLWHEGTKHAVVVGDFAGGHAEKYKTIGRGQRVGIGVIQFELPIAVFVVDLIDVKADLLQAQDQILEERAIT